MKIYLIGIIDIFFNKSSRDLIYLELASLKMSNEDSAVIHSTKLRELDS